MHTQQISYQADGLTMDSQLFRQSVNEMQPGILVFPEAFGLGEHALSRAERLAHQGYAALACDLWGHRRSIDSMEELMAALGPLHNDVAKVRARAHGGLEALKACAGVDARRIAAIGFCFGGSMALELARSGASIAAAVGFHSRLATAAPEDAKNIKAKVLVCIGADDPLIPPDQRRAFEEEMRAGKVNWQMNLFGGAVHSFTNPGADKMGNPGVLRYDARADAWSWQQMNALFDEVFAPTNPPRC